MKKMISLLLSAMLLLMLLPACQGPDAQSEPPERQPAASEVVNAMLPVSGYNGQSGNLEYLTAGADGAGLLTVYLENAYGLSDEAWEDAAIIRATGASAFELAVLRLENQDEASRAVVLLTAYISDRQGDFVGYAPEQADMVSKGEIAQNGAYAALCICPDSDRAAAAFFAAVSGELQTEPALPTATPRPDLSDPGEYVTPEPQETEYGPEDTDNGKSQTESQQPDPPPSATLRSDPAGPGEYATPEPQESRYEPDFSDRCQFVQPNLDDMSLYDTSAIRAAWKNGDPSPLSNYDKDIFNAAKNVLNRIIKNGMSDLEKEAAVYSWIVNNVNYDWTHQDVLRETPRESFTPYGGLVNRTAVCLGYATTFQLLMDLAGVECVTVIGAAFSSQEDHGWNMVRLNGNWYCVDVTWDANYREYGVTRGQEKDWVYFNVTSDEMAATDHQWDYANTPEAVTKGNGRG